jgi:hypothetical protein
MTSFALRQAADAGTLAIVTPSMVGSAQRAAFARDSLAELQKLLGGRFAHIVVDDPPGRRGRLLGVVPRRLTRLIPNLAFYWAAKEVYSRGRNIEFLRGGGGNSLNAVRRALRRARERGCSIVFIHLDDNAYADTLPQLVSHSIAAMANLPQLGVVRMSAYPILTGACNREQGNMSLCQRTGDTVRFDSVTLQPARQGAFTVWLAPWESSTADGRFWPVMLWNAVYRIEFLERLLSHPGVAGLAGLGDVEAWYKANWSTAWRGLDGCFGFINMQFAGLERERNANWQELIALPNRAVL